MADDAVVEEHSAQLPLLAFYQRHKPAPRGEALANALFLHLIHTAHLYYHLQLERTYSIMCLCLVDEASIGPFLRVAALSTEKVLTTRSLDQRADPLTEALEVQAKLKYNNPPAMLSISLHFQQRDTGIVSVFDHLIDMECRCCTELGTITCPHCHSAKYCCKDHQEKHWAAGHKNVCKKLGI